MDGYEEKSQAFLAWLSEISVSLNSKISLVDLRSQHAGRGVVATGSIAEDEVLFTVPRKSVLIAQNSDLATKLPHVFEQLDSWTALILVMVYEYVKGADSSWKPYFDILPTQFDTLMFWTQAEFEELQASAVKNKIGKISADKTFREQILPIVHANSALFTQNANSISDVELLNLAHRMGSTIMAYAFDIEKSEGEKEFDEEGYASDEDDEVLPKGMVPLADMLNADADRNNARLFYEEDALVMKAMTPITAGQEIFNDYGPLPRSDLLRRYGYITSNYAKYDVVEVPHGLLVDTFVHEGILSRADVQSRLEYLDGEDIVDSGYDICRPTPGEPIQECFSPELLTVITALLMSASDFSHMQERGRLPKLGPMSTRMARLLLQIVKNHASQYATTFEEDQKLMATLLRASHSQIRDSGHQRRIQMAIEVRMGEKSVLKDAERVLRRLESDAIDSEHSEKRKADVDPEASSKKRKVG